MAQFYFLSVLLNVLAGLILVYGKNLAQEDEFSGEGDSVSSGSTILDFNSPVFRLVVGILCIFVAVMKILSVFRNDVPVIGDLFPVLAGFAAGFSILLEYYMASSSEPSSVPPAAGAVLGSRKIIGAVCIAAGILHFVFPQIVLL
ncbi:MAG: hypothetical protein J6K96_09050 [Treponema sp.]|nr:hypothetical protein [Treponema sp.]